MKKWLIFGLLASVSFSVLLIAILGIPPRAIKIIDPSRFKNMQHLGFSIYRRLSQEINNSSIVVLGSSPLIQNYQQVWQGLLLAQKKYRPQDMILIEQEGLNTLAESYPFVEVVKIKQQVPVVEIQALTYKDAKFIIHTVNHLSSRLNANSFTQKIQESLKIIPLSLAQTQFAVSSQNLIDWQLPCSSENPLYLLNCKTIEVSKKYFRKHYSPKDLWGVVEKHKTNDFLSFIYQPK
ncbi:MAG: hypothetical protein KDD40_00695 [Bdellovibrionales bacterium]|nr:hypothetical protein [Bdellovibrionales bacterium]